MMKKTLIIKGKDRGFALIATITLMVLLALLSVGLLTMASSQTRISQRGLFAAEARAQAKLAVEVAIGRLQCELGPDQRISANSGILDTSPDSETIDGVGNPYILGVWDSWDTWMNRKNSKGLSLADTYNKGRKELFRSWLISSSLEENTRDMNTGAKDLGQFRSSGGGGDTKVQLLGGGSLGRNADKNKMIYAGLVQVDDMSTPIGSIKDKRPVYKKSIAWWISGENQKAKINIPTFKNPSNDNINILRSTWNTPAPDIAAIGNLDQIKKSLPEEGSDEYARKLSSLITFDTIGLITGRDSSAGESFHDISLDSSSLLTDVKFGGLKKDLNLLLSQEKLPDDFQGRDADRGLRPYSTEDGSPTVANRPISSWNQLYQWANLWNPVSSDGQDDSAKLKMTGNTPYTLVAADADAVEGMMNNKHTYVRHPILLKTYSFVGIQYNRRDANYEQFSGSIDMLYSTIPVMVWWNPYNVPMRMEGAGGQPYGSNFAAHRLMPIQESNNAAGRDLASDDRLLQFSERYFSPCYLSDGTFRRPLHDYGSTFRKTTTIDKDGNVKKGEISTLQPGEIMMFAQPSLDYITANQSNNPDTAIYKIKAAFRDAIPDAIPLKEGWDLNSRQVRPYAIDIAFGVRYDALDGNEFGGIKYKGYSGPLYRITNVRFASSNRNQKNDEFLTKDPIILSHFYTDEYTTQNKKLGSFMITSGVMDDSKLSTRMINENNSILVADQNSQWLKASPSVLNLNWGIVDLKAWDNVLYPHEKWKNDPNRSEEDKRKGKGGRPRDEDPDPTFVSYYGVSLKWGTKPLLTTPVKEGENYQTKIWQHSSPLLWGGQIIDPSELAKTYSPYQFEFKQGTGVNEITLEKILSTDGTKQATFGGPGSEQVNRIIAAELPLHPPYSLAGFAGFRLSPGWYEEGGTKALMAKRFAYQSGVPGVGIGNSFADPMLPADQIFSHNEIAGDASLGDFWDHGLMVNDGLWDTWFTSSISSRPSSLGGQETESLQKVVKDVFSDTKSSNNKEKTQLPNQRIIPVVGKGIPSEISDELLKEDGYKKAAKHLVLDGGFNVNSTNATAWKSIFSGLKKRRLLHAGEENGTPKEISNDEDTALFSRFGIASADASHVDDMGASGVMNGYPVGSFMSWTDLRKIDSRNLDKMALMLVSEVKRRGPFLNMAEFINRRLASGETGIKGALQAAIDKSGANSVFDSMSTQYINPPVQFPNQEAAKGSYYTAAPGYLIQSDVLAVLGNILTVRDDSFKIRAYGEVSDKSGKNILARSWCEAIVKRGISYVDPTNSPETPSTVVNYQTGELSDSDLTKINRAFGRKFEIVSFRWLTPEEV